MKKAGKFVAFVLVFALIIAVLSGMDLYDSFDSQKVSADAGTGTVKVVIISGDDITSNVESNVSSALPTGITLSAVERYSQTEFNNDVSVIDDAGLIVVNVPLSAADDLSWDAAYAIFQKVCGLRGDGKPAKYLIASDAYGSISDGQVMNGGATEFRYYPRLSNQGLKFDSSVDNSSVKSKGSNKNVYKLFLMLTLYDNPAVFNSLFFGFCCGYFFR